MPETSEPGFDLGLDWMETDEITSGEADRLIRWYEESHGDGDISLTQFVPFLIRFRPGALKTYRRYQLAAHRPGGLPQAAIALMFLHYYMVTCSERGVRYQVIAGRQWGATKHEVLDVLQMGFLVGGPLGGNAAAEATDYLERWDEDEPRVISNPWPENWAEPASSGGASTFVLDEADATEKDIASIIDGYRAEGRSVPAYVSFLGVHAPDVLKQLRARYDHTLAVSRLPVQLATLIRLHTAAIMGSAIETQDAALAARAAGVTSQQAVEALCWAFLYTTEGRMNEIATGVSPSFAEWA